MRNREKKELDFILFFTTIVLLAIGIVMVFSASAINASILRNDPYFFLKRQGFWAATGLCGMFFMSKVNYWKLKDLVTPLLVVSFILLIAVFIPGVGVEINYAKRWIGIAGQSIQPSEITKLALIIFTAAHLAKKNIMINHFSKAILPPLIMLGLSFILILKQPDLGTALAITGTVFIIIIIAGMPIWQLGLMGVTTTPLMFYFVLSEDYRRKRLLSFMNPWEDPLETGYHIIQSLFALGPGGLLGVGLGRSRQKLFYLPEPQNDFIFAIIGEELGFIGAIAIIILFFILLWRGFKIAMSIQDSFGSLLATGITAMIAIQVIINIGVVTGSMPVTGINLPLISAGGSSLFFTLVSIGILLNISKYVKETN